jgi:Tetraspanin family
MVLIFFSQSLDAVGFLTIFLVLIAFWVALSWDKVEMKQEMFSSINKYRQDPNVTEAWDKTQSSLECCGVESFRDWKDKIPISCCPEINKFQPTPCQKNPSESTVFGTGCLDIVAKRVHDRSIWIFICAVIIGCLVIFGSCFLRCSSRALQ